MRQMFFIMMMMYSCLLLLLFFAHTSEASHKKLYPHLQCRDPAFGNGNDQISSRKFLILTGRGGGIGNYLIFYPSAYYFAAMTGRDLIILDNSIMAEMCRIIHCGFPLYSEAQMAYPGLLDPGDRPPYKELKNWDFRRHLWGEHIVQDRAVYADGYKFFSGWYSEHNFSTWCIQKLTGCKIGDTSCEDRHAYQQLIRGPFKRDIETFFQYLSGVPANLKRALLTLPHAMAPRLDAAIHLRCQFRHFEYLVGPEDSLWPQHQQEISDFLTSTEYNQGEQLFKVLAQQVSEQVQSIVEKKKEQRRRLTHFLQKTDEEEEAAREKGAAQSQSKDDHYHDNYHSNHNNADSDHRNNNRYHIHDGSNKHRYLRYHQNNSHNQNDHESKDENNFNNHEYNRHSNRLNQQRLLTLNFAAENASAATTEARTERETYVGDALHDHVYLYLASDNDQVKEAFAAYLINHHNLSVLRVKTGKHIAHAKNIGWLTSESSGSFTLVADWYALSLANLVIAWRRDTNIVSTFAMSAQRVSGNSRVAAGSDFAEENDPFLVQTDNSNDSSNNSNNNDNNDNDKNSNKLAKEATKHVRGLQLIMVKGKTHWSEF